MNEFIVIRFIEDIMLRRFPLINKQELSISARYTEFGDLNVTVMADYEDGGRSETRLEINIKRELLKDIPLQKILERGRQEFEECLDCFEFGFVPRNSKTYWEEPISERYVWSLPELYSNSVKVPSCSS